jgi:ABC-2 type transport system ATP-binding protein
MTRAEIDSRFEKIVAFSELERFLDTPVKRYSSGMYARLGFSVAAHVNPDILLIDEVLAVGDVAFQSKCYQRMGELKKNGTTIIFVTHTMPTMRRLCDRAILLYQGKIQASGEPAHVVETYLSTERFSSNLSTQLDSNGQESAIDQKKSTGPVVIGDVFFVNADGIVVESCKSGESLTVHIDYKATQETHNPSVTVKIRGSDGTLYDGFNSAWDGIRPEVIYGNGSFEISIDPICLLDGNYLISVMIADADGLELFDWHSRRYKLRVIGGASASSHGIMHMPHEWQWMPDKVNNK